MRKDLRSGKEFNEYYTQYVNLVGDAEQLVEALRKGKTNTVTFFNSLSREQLEIRYAEGKWTPKEVLLHLIDTERIFTYRALRISRMDTTPLVGFDQDDFVLTSFANNRSISSLLSEYESVREASISLYENLDAERRAIIGTASESPLSPRAAGYITAGHEKHHITIIKERYL